MARPLPGVRYHRTFGPADSPANQLTRAARARGRVSRADQREYERTRLFEQSEFASSRPRWRAVAVLALLALWGLLGLVLAAHLVSSIQPPALHLPALALPDGWLQLFGAAGLLLLVGRWIRRPRRRRRRGVW